MSGGDIGTFMVVTIMVTFVGASLGHSCVSRMFGLWKSLLSCIAFTVVTTIAFVLMCRGPEHKEVALLFAVPWGICLGWYYPSKAGFYSSIIPGGQETEMMGLLTCFSYLISWLPTLTFAIVKELTGDNRPAMISIVLFHTIGAVLLLTVDEVAATQDVQGSLTKRRFSPATVSPAVETHVAVGVEKLMPVEQTPITSKVEDLSIDARCTSSGGRLGCC